jgi:hypothetical protein
MSAFQPNVTLGFSVCLRPIADISGPAKLASWIHCASALNARTSGTASFLPPFSTAGFAGTGSAWFATEKLRDFGKAVSGYPLEPQSLPSIIGGVGGEAGAPDQVHLAIKLEPHGSRGIIRVTVSLASDVWNGEEEDLACTATVRFLTTYADLGRFGSDFLAVVEGQSSEATLEPSAD